MTLMFWRATILFTAVASLMAVLHAAVVELDPSNFHSVVDGSTNVFVNFYAPWSPFPSLLLPPF
jgi:hypothetical protein